MAGTRCCKPAQCFRRGACRFHFPYPVTAEPRAFINRVGGKPRKTFAAIRNDPWLNQHSKIILLAWRANVDMQPVLDREAASKYISKYASKPEAQSESYHAALKDFCSRLPRGLPAERAVQSLFARMAADRDISAQEAIHLLLGEPLVGCSRGFVNLNAQIDAPHVLREPVDSDDGDAAFREPFFSHYQTRPAYAAHLNAVDFCKQYSVSHHPSFLLLRFRVLDIHRLPGDGVTGFHARRKPVVVRAWPRTSSIPARHDPAFEHWAIAQLRLYKPHRSIQELSTPSVDTVFSQHLACGGFPNLLQLSTAEETEADSDEVPDDAEDNLLRTAPLETDLLQDDYQVLMDVARLPCESTQLLGLRELDLAYPWPTSWNDFSFKTLVSWIGDTKKTLAVPPLEVGVVSTESFSSTQRFAFCVIEEHCFANRQNDQLLMIVLGTAGTGKSYLINAVRQRFRRDGEEDRVKVTAPTGIAATNISGTTIYSLLVLMKATLTSQRLLGLQQLMQEVKLLIIDEYSFLSAAFFDLLDQRLRSVFPHSHRPFGGLNIVLCGDPAQLPPVRAQPVYAHRGTTEHVAARFHLFQTVVELDRPFRQVGSDHRQVQFRDLLGRVADCVATEEDWKWLQNRRGCCLTPSENDVFDGSKYIVATNKVRHKINYERLSQLAPVMVIPQYDDAVQLTDIQILDGERLENNELHVFAVGAEVMLSNNLWTEAGLVNGSCGIVRSLLVPPPPDNSDCRIVMVDFPDYHGPVLSPHSPTVVPITQVRTPHFRGLPLSLSWAITIHKSQGLSMDHVTVDLGEREFAAGITFVALSRAKRFDSLRTVAFDFDRYRHIENGINVQARRFEFTRLRILALQTLQYVFPLFVRALTPTLTVHLARTYTLL